jgi:hypothetical protein
VTDGLFKTLLDLLMVPLRPDRGVKTDRSILLIYPPPKELDFREYLIDTFVPALEANKVPFRLLDLTGFLFSGLTDEVVATLEEDEFDDYRWMQQGLSRRAESSLQTRLTTLADEVPGGSVIVYGTVALYPLVRYSEVLRGLRDLDARIVLAFPGEERGGRLHFMNQPDGGNYLAVKLYWR